MSFTYCPLNSSVEDISVVIYRRVSKILHNERTVSEDVDHVTNVNRADLVHLLSFLVRVGRTVTTYDLFEEANLHWALGDIKIELSMSVGPLGLP